MARTTFLDPGNAAPVHGSTLGGPPVVGPPTPPDLGTPSSIEKQELAEHDEKLDLKRSLSGDTTAARHLEILNDPDFLADEKQVVRRLDMTLLPTLWILYLFNYLDRTNIAQARLNSFMQDLNLTDENFSTAVAVLTAGYMAMQLPSNMLITRVRPSIYLPTCALLWSGVSAATAGTTSYASLIGVRFVLGIVEAPLFPGAVYCMSCWYKRSELALRTAILYSGLVLAQAVSGLLAAGIFQLDGVAGLAGWKWLFILEAAAGSLLAIGAFFTLPDYPHSKTGSTRWSMTERQRMVAVARMQADRLSIPEAKNGVWHGAKLAITDHKTWIFMFLNLANTAAYGFNNFFPTIVRGFGLGSDTIALLLTSPPYLTGTIVSFLIAWDSDRRKERGWHVASAIGLAMVGFIISVATINNAARYTASFLYTVGCFSANALIYSWAVSTLSDTPEKRAAAGAIVNIVGHVGNIISPYFFVTGGPAYTLGMVLMLAFAACTVVTSVFLKFNLTRLNKKLRVEADARGESFNAYLT